MLTNDQKDRYSRQIILKEIGSFGQEKLTKSSVLVIGTGGLGSPIIYALACAGVGTIGIADFDSVELNNLNRQFLHWTSDIGKPKTASAKEKIFRLDPHINVIEHNLKIDAENINEVISTYDMIADCSDNFETKFLINDACIALKKSFSHGAVSRFTGQVLTVRNGQGPCLRCLFKEPPPQEAELTCHSSGIVGSVAGIIGNIQATEIIKCLVGTGELLTGKILIFESLVMHLRIVEFPKAEDCICGEATLSPTQTPPAKMANSDNNP